MTYVQFVIFSLVVFYALFILLWLALDDIIEGEDNIENDGLPEVEKIFKNIDLVMLVIFEFEIVLIYFSDFKAAITSYF